jgi:hypothetical protein
VPSSVQPEENQPLSLEPGAAGLEVAEPAEADPKVAAPEDEDGVSLMVPTPSFRVAWK